jgi:hypothetical protein
MKLSKLFKRAVNGKTLEWEVEVKGACFRTISGYTDGIKTTSEWTCCEAKNVGNKNSTTAEEQAFVLSQMTQAAFDQAHRIISESKDLYTTPAARPLVLPAAAPQRFGSLLAPLTSAAAAATLTYFFF